MKKTIRLLIVDDHVMIRLGLAALMADEIAIGVFNNKTTATRIVPVPGKKAGEFVSFGGLFGESVIMPVPGNGCSHDFVSRGGHIPAPIQSLRN